MVYLDNAATSFPKPAGVVEAVRAFMLYAGANPGRSGHRLALAAAPLRSSYRWRTRRTCFSA